MIRTPAKLRRLISRGVNFPQTTAFTRTYQNERVQAFIVRQNVKQLHVFGHNIKGEIVGLYSQRTEDIFGPPKFEGDPYNFDWTGEFFKSFKAIPQTDGSVRIEADDRKTTIGGADIFLTEIYGEILGFTDDSKGKISRFILPFINRETRAILFAK